jgi:hypothetical protein
LDWTLAHSKGKPLGGGAHTLIFAPSIFWPA